jgi:ribulose-bisphosphate carboxylase large chain
MAKLPFDLSGERFIVVYRLTGDEAEARVKAENICIDQTIEFPLDLLPEGHIRDHIVGRIESFAPLDGLRWEARISYAVENTGFEVTQFLNAIFGVAGLSPGVRLMSMELPEALLRAFKGPRLGRQGLRELLRVPDRPLIATALKPLGTAPEQLAALTYRFALGGIDIIKDDHMLGDQPYCSYEERVVRCADAVRLANRQTGYHSIYVPAVPGPVDRVVERAVMAREAGAGGLLVCPGLVGPDMMRRLADDDRIGLPIFYHPAFQFTYVTAVDGGLSHYALFGQIARLTGADGNFFPNYGGRFSFTAQDCRDLAAGCAAPMGHIRPIFPGPAGGMTLERIPELFNFYGREAIFLIGIGLQKAGPDLVANARKFRDLVERVARLQPEAAPSDQSRGEDHRA